MAFYGKEFVLEKQENFEGFVNSFGDDVPEAYKKALIAHKTTAKLEKNGDTYTLTTTQPEGPSVATFKNGVEFDQEVGEGAVTKTIMTMDGNVLTQIQKFEKGVVFTTKREFSDNQLILTLNSTGYDGTVKRWYKPA